MADEIEQLIHIYNYGFDKWLYRALPEVREVNPVVYDLFKEAINPATIAQGTSITQFEYLTFTFYENSVAVGTGKGIPASITVDRDCIIDKVYIHVETAPGSGKTITVDVNKNGTTIFTTQGNRPSIVGTNTTDESGTPNVTSLTKNDELTMDIDTSDGSAAKLSVYVRCLKNI